MHAPHVNRHTALRTGGTQRAQRHAAASQLGYNVGSTVVPEAITHSCAATLCVRAYVSTLVAAARNRLPNSMVTSLAAEKAWRSLKGLPVDSE